MPNIIRTGGGAVKVATFLYEQGNEHTAITGGWNIGYLKATGSQSKETDHLKVNGTSVTARRTYVTNNAINLTNFSTLKIDWSGETNGNSVITAMLTAATDPAGDPPAITLKGTAFARTIDTLDISSLNGSYYIAVCSNSISANITRAYKVWLE